MTIFFFMIKKTTQFFILFQILKWIRISYTLSLISIKEFWSASNAINKKQVGERHSNIFILTVQKLSDCYGRMRAALVLSFTSETFPTHNTLTIINFHTNSKRIYPTHIPVPCIQEPRCNQLEFLNFKVVMIKRLGGTETPRETYVRQAFVCM